MRADNLIKNINKVNNLSAFVTVFFLKNPNIRFWMLKCDTEKKNSKILSKRVSQIFVRENMFGQIIPYFHLGSRENVPEIQARGMPLASPSIYITQLGEGRNCPTQITESNKLYKQLPQIWFPLPLYITQIGPSLNSYDNLAFQPQSWFLVKMYLPKPQLNGFVQVPEPNPNKPHTILVQYVSPAPWTFQCVDRWANLLLYGLYSYIGRHCGFLDHTLQNKLWMSGCNI